MSLIPTGRTTDYIYPLLDIPLAQSFAPLFDYTITILLGMDLDPRIGKLETAEGGGGGGGVCAYYVGRERAFAS